MNKDSVEFKVMYGASANIHQENTRLQLLTAQVAACWALFQGDSPEDVKVRSELQPLLVVMGTAYAISRTMMEKTDSLVLRAELGDAGMSLAEFLGLARMRPRLDALIAQLLALAIPLGETLGGTFLEKLQSTF